MKRFYSIILLLSLLIGVTQPVMPMMEYLFHQGNLTELIHPSSAGDFCEMRDIQEICTDCDCCDHSESESMLDTEYYPIPLQITADPAQHVLNEVTEPYSIGDSQLIFTFYKTLVPPPKTV